MNDREATIELTKAINDLNLQIVALTDRLVQVETVVAQITGQMRFTDRGAMLVKIDQ